MADSDIDSLTSLIGRDLGPSRWVAVDQSRIDRFAACTGDHQWIHVDAERARTEGPFGATIAHGYLTMALLARFAFEILIEPAGITQAVNYGIDKARFLAPVRSGARIRGRLKPTAVEDKGKGRRLVTADCLVEIEGEDKPALAGTILVLVTEA